MENLLIVESMSVCYRKFLYPLTTQPSGKGTADLGNLRVDLCLSGAERFSHKRLNQNMNSLMLIL